MSGTGHAHAAEHFESLAKQTHAARLGMWVFLATELLLFAGLFVAYSYYRYLFTEDFITGAHHLKRWVGSLNTFILLISSFLVAMALHYVRAGRPRMSALMLFAAAGLGFVFLGFKAYEYYSDIQEGLLPGRYLANPELRTQGASVFLSLYYMTTGLHAIHVTIGITVLLWVAVLTWRRTYSPEYHTPVELGGMYWHLVDVIWIFVWPLMYLI